MSVESFDPNILNKPLDQQAVESLLAELTRLVATGEDWADQLPDFDAAAYVQLASHADWAEASQAYSSDQLVALIRLFTVAETRFPGWRADDKSPVIPWVALLKSRGEFTPELKRWIKARTDNRFLPHGSLMDRL
ncbi:MAG: hypothetical protein AAF513_15855 [Pseudomonadota bacterium]